MVSDGLKRRISTPMPDAAKPYFTAIKILGLS